MPSRLERFLDEAPQIHIQKRSHLDDDLFVRYTSCWFDNRLCDVVAAFKVTNRKSAIGNDLNVYRNH
jgi:hypothetical protein